MYRERVLSMALWSGQSGALAMSTPCAWAWEECVVLAARVVVFGSCYIKEGYDSDLRWPSSTLRTLELGENGEEPAGASRPAMLRDVIAYLLSMSNKELYTDQWKRRRRKLERQGTRDLDLDVMETKKMKVGRAELFEKHRAEILSPKRTPLALQKPDGRNASTY